MMLTILKIEHYRGINALELVLGPTTVLVGENNCGKTTVLHALRSWLTMSYGEKYNGWRKAPSRFLFEMGLLVAKQ